MRLIVWFFALALASCQLVGPLDGLEADVPVPNGLECTIDDDCDSNMCGEETGSGRKLCYGRAGANEPCDITADCAAGQCHALLAANEEDGPGRVCWEFDSDGCYRASKETVEQALEICQHFQRCSTRGDASACFNAQCSFLNEHGGERKSIVDSVVRTDGCCLPAGKGVCGTTPQCGCPKNQNCIVDALDGATICVDVGTIPVHQRCEAEDCMVGHTCIRGQCRKICAPNAPAGGDGACKINGSQCFQAVLSKDLITPVPGSFYCTQPCNLADPTQAGDFTKCAADATCDWRTDHSDCTPLGEMQSSGAMQGADCSNDMGKPDSTLCARGHFCDEPSATCVQYCRLGSGASPCAHGSCRAFPEPRTVAKVEFGFCAE